MLTNYTKTFKIECVKKFLNRPVGESGGEVARRLGIGKSTLYAWALQAQEGKMCEDGPNSHIEKRPQEWVYSERFDAILEVQNMNEEEKNSYCRNKGIFPHHLKKWEQEFKEDPRKQKKRSNTNEMKALKTKIKTLQKELKRKDKALAEAAALLILKKKVQEIWGDDEEF